MKNLIIFLLTALLLLAVVQCRQQSQEADSQLELLGILEDTLRSYRNAEGQWVAERQVLEGDYKTLRRVLSDSLSWLRQALDRQTANATYWKTVSQGQAGGQTEVRGSDTVYQRVNDTVYVYIYPEYRAFITDRWSEFQVLATRDSTDVMYKIRNEFLIEQHRTRKWLLGKENLEVRVINRNPNTFTTELVSLNVRPKKRSVIPWVIGGLVVGYLVR